MWYADSGGHLHNKNRPVSYKQHEVTYALKRYCSSFQYTEMCGMPASWAAQHIIMCLDLRSLFKLL